VIGKLPAGPITLTFQLDGFSPSVVGLAVIEPNVDAIVHQRLALATRSETVDVYGTAPRDTPLPQQASAPSPPALVPVPAHDRDSICGPAKPGATAESFGTIRSRRDAADGALYSKGDEVLIDGGTILGLDVGRNLVARRTYQVREAHRTAVEHTAGVLQIIAADEHASTALVIYACDELMRGDRLAPFKPEPIRPTEPAGIPDYTAAARILFADFGQMVGVQGRLMVIDRGTGDGVQAGQRLTLFREGRGSAQSAVVGDAVVVAVRADSATVRVEHATDVIQFGDWAAPHRNAPVVSPHTPGVLPQNR